MPANLVPSNMSENQYLHSNTQNVSLQYPTRFFFFLKKNYQYIIACCYYKAINCVQENLDAHFAANTKDFAAAKYYSIRMYLI